MRSKLESRITVLALVAMAATLTACGGGTVERQPTVATVPRADEAHREDESSPEPPDNLAVTGLMGTIDPDAVQMAMDVKQQQFLDCFSRRLDAIDVLAGDIRLAFRIGVDGHVLWVYPKTSTIGDRETEQCILRVAAGAHFRRPTGGGEAEFGYPLSFDVQGDSRQPVPWTSDRLADVLAEHAGVTEGCGMQGAAHVTMYVGQDGRVLAAGATAETREANAQLDCVLAAVREWSLPAPGSYPAKVSFDLQ